MQIKRLTLNISILGLFLVWLISFPAWAENAFSPQEANSILNKLSIKLSIQNLVAEDLEETSEIIRNLQNEAKQCVEEIEQEIKNLKLILPADLIETADLSKLSTNQIYLRNRLQDANTKLTECRLFVLHSQEAIQAFTDTARSLTAIEVIKGGPQIWKDVSLSKDLFQQILSSYDLENFIKKSGIEYFTNIYYLILIFSAIVISILLTPRFRRQLNESILPETAEGFSPQLIQATQCTLKKHCFSLALMANLSIVFILISIIEAEAAIISILVFATFAFVLCLSSIYLFFQPPPPSTRCMPISKPIAKALAPRLKFFLVLLFIGYLAFILVEDQELPFTITHLTRTLYVTFVTFTVFSIIYIINRAPRFLQKHRTIRRNISMLVSGFLFVVLASEWLGYHGVSTYLLTSTALSVLFIFVAWFLDKALMTLVSSLSDNKSPWQKRLHNTLGIKEDATLPELIALKIVLEATIWVSLGLSLLKIWGLSQKNIDILIDSVIFGFHVSNIEIIPSRIVFGLLFFTVFIGLTRLVRAKINKSLKEDTENAVAQLFGYVGFFITVIMALLIAGVNFQGLALIAGALSVGIGFGLQNIVNNFVSGIVLLLEKPIKPGDRIVVGEIEGFVRKIRIRSTQVRTIEHSDVMIPNADLMAEKVTNFMYNNRNWLVKIKVAVVYGSDCPLVDKLLYQIGIDHPNVYGDGPYQPLVFLKAFGDNAIEFEMWCTIHDVNLKEPTNSELNKTINEVFQEHAIRIAFPQLRIHFSGDELPIKMLEQNDGYSTPPAGPSQNDI